MGNWIRVPHCQAMTILPFVGEGGENNAKELVVLIMSPSPWHVTILQSILVISEVGKHAIHLEQLSQVQPLCLLVQGQSRANPYQNLDVEFVGLYECRKRS